MSKKTVHQGQSFLDKVLENTGSIENAFEMALLNGISVTDDMIIGQELLTVPATKKPVVSFFSEKKPATGITISQEGVLIPELGIGTMAIKSTFIIR